MATKMKKKAGDGVQALYKTYFAARKRLLAARRKAAALKVSDYPFTDQAGKQVKLSRLFGKGKDLIVVHNMGTGCSYCTMWADGFNGVREHLSDRAAFVVVSPDKPAVQKKFAAGRGWKFPMLSSHGTTFFKDMGFEQNGKPWPGVSAFRKERGGIQRTDAAPFGPGDEFCSVWPFFEMLQDGADRWGPKYRY